MDENTYEVRCESCDVSFPIGTKTCLHCGEPVGGSAIFNFGRDPSEPLFGESMPVEQAEEAGEPESQRRPFRFGVTMIWLAALVLSAAQRACQGN